jgi:hypothetical protein
MSLPNREKPRRRLSEYSDLAIGFAAVHMAYDIKKQFFSIKVEGEPTDRQDLLDWDLRDRLGVVVREPVGTIDAGLLIFLAVTAFYDAAKKRRMRPLYPDIFVFHAGGPWGMHSAFDFAPDHKEIFVDNDPVEMLRAINNRGITHLAVPDCPRKPVRHRYKEPEAAHDRIKRCFAYGRGGSAANSDVEISARPFSALVGTYESALYPRPFLELIDATGGAPEVRATNPEEIEYLKAMMRRRISEVDEKHPVFLRHAERVAKAKIDDHIVDHYRRIDISEALEMLDYR